MVETKIKLFLLHSWHFLKIVAKKITPILPIWGVSLALAIIFLFAGKILDQNSQGSITTASAELAPVPQVLGASTDIRGETASLNAIPEFTGQINDATVSAQSFLVADMATKTILAEKNSDQKEAIASLTKLLTALVTYENVDINTTVPITTQDVFSVSPILGLRPGDNVAMLDVFNAMLVGSCNDAARTLANHVQDITGKDFVGLMNQKAQELGMDESHFSNPLGFDSPDNYSTAHDLFTLVQTVEQLSVFTSLGKKTGYTFSGDFGSYHAVSTNKLVGKFPEIEAVKTGSTAQAGQAMISKASENGHTVVIIVLNSRDRDADTTNLESQVFENTQWQ